MATLVVYGETTDAYIVSQANSGSGGWTASRNGTNTLVLEPATDLTFSAGRYTDGAGTYYTYQPHIAFDASVLDDADTISAAVLSMVLANTGTLSEDLEAFLYDWGAAVDTVDFRSGTWLTTGTKLATRAVPTSLSANTRYDWTDVALAANISKSGVTRMVLAAEGQRTDTPPTGSHVPGWNSADATGTTNDPKLTITYSWGSSGTRVVYGETNDDALLNDNATWATARDGSGAVLETSGLLCMASANPGYFRVCQSGVRFLTEGLGAAVNVTDAILNLEAGSLDNLGTEVVEAFIFDFGDTVDTADWQDMTELGALTRVATKAMPVTTGVRYDFTNVALPANINKTGYTYIWLAEQANRTNVTPTTNHFIGWKNADTAGTTSDPKLTITWSSGTTHDGAVSIAGAGSMSALAGLLQSGALSINGAGAFAAAGSAPHSAKVSIVGSSSLGMIADIRHPRLPYLKLDESATEGDLTLTKAPQGDVIIF